MHLFTCLFYYQQLPDSFDMKAKIEEILGKNGFAEKRARTMDIDDFLQSVFFLISGVF